MKKHQKSTTHRFFLQHTIIPEQISPGTTHLIDSSEPTILHQMTKVFRCHPGDNLILLNQNPPSKIASEFLFEITDFDKKHLNLKLIEQKINNHELNFNLELAFGLPNKPAKLDFILEKAVELGVTKIHLIKTEFSQFSHELKISRLQKILLEAAEQSERGLIPLIQTYDTLPAFLTAQKEANPELRILAALERSASSPSLLTFPKTKNSLVLIGPEGGFSLTEIKTLNEQNIATFNLGGTILRMETACLLALGILAIQSNSL